MIINAYSTLRQIVDLNFLHQIHAVGGREDRELIEHLGGLMALICDQGNREMVPTLYLVMRHLERTRHHYVFDVPGLEMPGLAMPGTQSPHPKKSDLAGASWAPIAAWARDSNSIVVLPDQTVRDPNGRLLVDPETGAAEDAAVVPFPDDAIERGHRNRQELTALGVETCDDLPPTMSEDEVVMRPDDEVAWRTLSLFIVAVRAESLASGQPIAVEQLRAKSPMALEAMTPLEQLFLSEEDPDPQSVINFAWRYEALYLLQWALGLHDQLKFADEICDVPWVAQTMVDHADRDIVNSAKLRPTSEILDALDQNRGMLWAARQARIENREPPAGLDGGILSERQHALNWLVQFGDAAWDDVDTPS